MTVEARLKRTGIEKRMVLGNGLEAATADPSLLRLIARAHGIGERLFDDTTLSLKEIAKEEDVVGSYVTRVSVDQAVTRRNPTNSVARPPIDDRATGSVVEIFDARSATRGFAQVRRGTQPPRGRRDAVAVEDIADRLIRHGGAQIRQRSYDAIVAPAGILPGQAHHQAFDVAIDSGSTGPSAVP